MIAGHGASHHLFAGDKQAYANAPLSDVDDVRGRLHDCAADLIRWSLPTRATERVEDRTCVVRQAVASRQSCHHGRISDRH